MVSSLRLEPRTTAVKRAGNHRWKATMTTVIPLIKPPHRRAELPVAQLQDGEEQDLWLDLQPPEEGAEEDSDQTVKARGTDTDGALPKLVKLRKVTRRHARRMKQKALQAMITNEGSRLHLKVRHWSRSKGSQQLCSCLRGVLEGTPGGTQKHCCCRELSGGLHNPFSYF